ncbi:PREDICTED: amine oxidase [flavin-containing]-like [Rhagoletis zephyria]|uniref:amine oxidase [flavin-containing]-like n=1 Tax=Rhagoletis zephyria TaxID=28612 RepID=UPI0008116F7D|nr:PREDICTED: amine oxidase [flavin-containing]-like [Rhagoletis zephyria]
MTSHLYDVVIIGGGVSGLSAAKYLGEQGVDLVLLEATERLGGRTRTNKNENVLWVDLGGAYVGRSQNHLLRIIKEFNLELYPVNEVEKLVYYDGFSGKRTLLNSDQLPANGLLDWLDLNHMFRLIDKIGEDIPADEPWKSPRAEKLDQMTCKEFLEANTIMSGARHFMNIFFGTLVTNPAYLSSALWFLWYIKQCGGTKMIFATTGGGQEFKVNGGTMQISERMAECVGMHRVLLGHAVYYVEQNDSEVLVKTLNGKEFRGRYTLDDSKWPDGSKPAIIGFLPSDKSRLMTQLTKNERQKIICESFAKAFNCPEALEPVHYEEHNWSAEPYVGGCYTSTLPPGFLTYYGPYLRQPIGRMFFGGTECATEWSGYINGAIQSGERSAREVLVQLGKLSADRICQDEPNSVDYPPVPFSSTFCERYAPSARGLFYGLAFTSLATAAAAGLTFYYIREKSYTSAYYYLIKV